MPSAKLDRVAMSLDAPLANPGTPIAYVAFPIDDVISTVTNMRDGATIEVTVTANEGFFGLPVLFGYDSSPNEAMIQIAGSVLCMRSADFSACVGRDRALNARSLLYAQTSFTTVAQFAGCNRLHPVNERCARWLLMAHDRVACDKLFLTHEYLATMLGVRRPVVSLAAAALEQAELIEYHRGRIIVRDRRGLEMAACECYGFVNDELERLLGYDVRKAAQDGTAMP